MELLVDNQEAAAVERIAGMLNGARVRLDGASGEDLEHAFPELDTMLRDTYFELEALRRYLTLFRSPLYEDYDPLEALGRYNAELLEKAECHGDAPPPLHGDPLQMVECIRLVRENIVMDPGTRLMVAVFLNSESPRIAVGVSGGGRLRDTFLIGPQLEVSVDELHGAWASATDGGGIDRDGETLSLHFQGEQPVPARGKASGAAWSPAARAAKRLQPWRAATGMYEPGLASPVEARTLYLKSIAHALADLDEVSRSLV
jgi:hypothetical protein